MGVSQEESPTITFQVWWREDVKEENGIKIVKQFDSQNQNPVDMQKQDWFAILKNFKKHVEPKIVA